MAAMERKMWKLPCGIPHDRGKSNFQFLVQWMFLFLHHVQQDFSGPAACFFIEKWAGHWGVVALAMEESPNPAICTCPEPGSPARGNTAGRRRQWCQWRTEGINVRMIGERFLWPSGKPDSIEKTASA